MKRQCDRNLGRGQTQDDVPRALGGQIPLIFDSDFGSFMDDSFALSYALGSPEVSQPGLGRITALYCRSCTLQRHHEHIWYLLCC